MSKGKIRTSPIGGMDTTGKPDGHGLLGPIAFTGLYLLIVSWFQWADIWSRHFATAGSVYILYHFLRTAFFLYLAFLVFFSGKTLLYFLTRDSQQTSLNSIEYFLLASYLGASLLVFILYVLGFLKLYYSATALMITLPLVFFSYGDFRRVALKIATAYKGLRQGRLVKLGQDQTVLFYLLTIVVIIQGLYLFISKGLMPDLLTNDTFGHYLPYYQEVINSHSLWMNKYWPHYYFSKGNGLFFLAGLLTDIQSTQLVSFYFLLLAALVLYAFIKRQSQGGTNWALLAVIIFFSSSIILTDAGLVVAEFQKQHIMIGSFIIFAGYMPIILLSMPAAAARSGFFLQMPILGAAIVISPISGAFILPLLIFQAGVSFFRKRYSFFKYSALAIVVSMTVLAALLTFNYLSSGLAEITPLGLFFQYRNDEILRQWLSPAAIQLQILTNTLSGEGAGTIGIDNLFNFNSFYNNFRAVLYDDALIPFIVYLVVLFLAAGVAVRQRRNKAIADLLPGALLSCFMLLIVFFLFTVVQQHSLYRYTFFLIFFRTALYITAFLLVIRHIPVAGIKKTLSSLTMLVLLGFSLGSFFSYSHSQSISLADKLNFLRGTTSYADLYQRKYSEVALGLQIQRSIGQDKKMVVMNFLPGLYGLPKSGFLRPFMGDYNGAGDFESVLFGSPEDAKRVLIKNNISYFLMVLDRPLLFTAYAPLFEPQNMKRYFKIAGSGNQVLLLSWRAEQEPVMGDDILAVYSGYREINRTNFYARSYEELKKSRTGKVFPNS